MDFGTWIDDTHKKIVSAIADSFNDAAQGAWQENNITTAVLKAIQSNGKLLEWDDCAQRVKWEAFKLSGENETAFGDIALLVKVWLTPTESIDGVAFYEAKRQYYNDKWDATGFQSLDIEQISRFGKVTHASQVLLYDVNLVDELISATAVPTALAIPLVKKGKGKVAGQSLLKFGRAFINPLANNLRGYELDFNSNSVSSMKQWLASHQPPHIVINVAVTSAPLTLKLDGFVSRLKNFTRIDGDDTPPGPAQSTPSDDDGPDI
ncbi:hypothetical protein ABVN23_28355 [Pseudomonas fluorescens]|uniref:hypothetical protein n=1 Tax=Pseudomonas fluorescens TaxID=294 RepID=UPI003F96BB17